VLGVASPGFLLDWELVALLPSFLSFIFACFVRGLPLHLVSVRPCCALFIKRGESLFRERKKGILHFDPATTISRTDLY
jgi:hypothetical protein